ncbi:uncharacterized protein [Palaemon carinicauda]|uniref:uncharacterized protein isoform X2 n=1 Tax=Palaemon carinicauda TaxID=392227 RepID=UPI0035B5807A
MVAQASGAETLSPAAWGRTSPMAAATAVKQQPMDFIKRKSGHFGLGVNGCELDVPSGSIDKARQPQVFQSSEGNQVFSKIPKTKGSLPSWKHGKHEWKYRWTSEQGNEQSSQDPRREQHHPDTRDTNEPVLCLLEKNKNTEPESDVSVFILENNQAEKVNCIQEQKHDHLQTGVVADGDQIVEDVYNILSRESNSESNCATEVVDVKSQEQQKQLIIIQSQDECIIQGNRQAIEEDSRKTSVECRNVLMPEGSLKVNGPHLEEGQGKEIAGQNPSELQSAIIGNDSQERMAREGCVSEFISAEEEDTDSNAAECDQGEVLIIADGDCQVVNFDSETENFETVAESLSGDGEYKQPCSKEDEDSVDLVPRSKTRSESQRKMKEGKSWLHENLQVVKDSTRVIKLSSIERSYNLHCKDNNKEPLATPVLARLIHSTFPDATKCRLGARKHQRIHYRRLQFKSDDITGNQLLAESTKDKQSQYPTSRLIQSRSEKYQPEVNPVLKLQQSLNSVNETKNELTQSIVDNAANEQITHLQEIEGDNSQKPQNQSDPSPQKPQNQSDPDLQKPQNQIDPPLNDEENCKRAARKVKEVLQWITSQGEPHKKALLRDFAHSASCQKQPCVPVCLMFRRIRRHVVAAQHSCSVLRLYSMLLRHHVASCTQANCGLPACPALRNTSCIKRKQEESSQPSKRMSVPSTLTPYPSSFVLSPRSPGGSLPGSPVNSPPSSPNSFLGMTPMTGQIQYVIMPVLMPVVDNQVN